MITKSEYTIAVIAKLSNEYERYVKKMVGWERWKHGKCVYDEWEYIHVQVPDDIRGWRFNCYTVVGCYRNSNYHDDDYHEILHGLKYCIKQSKSTLFS